jgi:hypothetical protein
MLTQVLLFVTKYLAGLIRRLWQWWPQTGWVAMRPHLGVLAQVERGQLPAFVQESKAAEHYLSLLGGLDWANFPERTTLRLWPGPRPTPRAAFVAAYLIKLDKGSQSMPKLWEYLSEQPALIWLLGFELVASSDYAWGFDAEKSLPTPRHLGRVLRQLDNAQVQFLFKSSVQLLDGALNGKLSEHFGNEISLDTKHIIAWVRENNPKARMSERYAKEKQPKGDKDCKVGCKKRHNQPTHNGSSETPSQEGQPASQATVGEFYWGYASGTVATKVNEVVECVLAEMTQTFDQGDVSYFRPLMAQTERNLGRKPQFGALDKAYDAFYVYEYFAKAGGFAAVPWADRADHKKQFNAEGLPLCAAGLAMPLKGKFMDKSSSLVAHECARYACPLIFPKRTGEECPIGHKQWPKGGCLTVLPTSVGNRVRHELDRSSDEYKRIYKQRTASERINSQALALGIERPHLRNQRSIANQNTLIYVLINLRALQRVQQHQAAVAEEVAKMPTTTG